MIRKRLLAGLFALLPLGVTFWLLKTIFQILIGISREPLFWAAGFLGIPKPIYWQQAIFSLLAMCCLLFLVGTLVQNYVGRRILSWLDALMLNIPGIKGIYGTVKQVMSSIQGGKGGSFKEVVLVHWPTPDSRLMGFVTSRKCTWATGDGIERVAVYIPTSPNPTSGLVIMLEESAIQPINIAPEQAITWVVSGGSVIPAQFNGKQ